MGERTAPANSRTVLDGEPVTGLNLALLWGRCSAGTEIRTFDSGRRMATFGIRTPGRAPTRARGDANDAATSVPIVVWDPPAWLEGLEADDPVVVVGRVRRRFFATRSGGRGAKTEVEAISVARATPAQLERASRRVVAAVAEIV